MRDFPGPLGYFRSLLRGRLTQGFNFGLLLGDRPSQFVGSPGFGLQKARQFLAFPLQPPHSVHRPSPELNGTAKNRTQCVQAGPNLVKGGEVRIPFVVSAPSLQYVMAIGYPADALGVVLDGISRVGVMA